MWTSVIADEGRPRRARAARVGVAVLFFSNGVLFSNVVPRYPEIKAELGLSNTALGSALAAFPLGSLLVGLFAAALIARYRSARVATTTLVMLAGSIPLVALAPSGIALALVLFVAGGLDAVMDVAQNSHGLRVQRLYARSVLNSFHGVWSIGAVTGGAMGSAAAGLGVPLATHLAATGVLFGVIALMTHRLLLTGPDDKERVAEAERVAVGDAHASSPGAVPRGLRFSRTPILKVVLMLGVLAALGGVVEDAGASWGAIYLREELGAAAATAGLAFVALQAAMTAGRLLGDRVVDRFGQRAVARTGGAAAALGMGFALTFPSVPVTIAAYAVAGLGVATLVPAAMHSADEIEGLGDAVGLTVVSWLLRVGFLLSPPLVGLVADATSLRVALLGVVLAGTGVLALGRVLPGRPSAEAVNRDR